MRRRFGRGPFSKGGFARAIGCVARLGLLLGPPGDAVNEAARPRRDRRTALRRACTGSARLLNGEGMRY